MPFGAAWLWYMIIQLLLCPLTRKATCHVMCANDANLPYVLRLQTRDQKGVQKLDLQ